jgi:cytochrome c biogenesis protein CcmG/thiol:disulfide interchange protein DsbE
MQRLFFILPLVLFLALAVALGFGLQHDPREIPSVLIDRTVPPLALMPVRAGDKTLSNDDLQGRVALLNVFASWCGACKQEHPTLMALHRDQAVVIYGLDWKDDPAECAAMLGSEGDPYDRVGGDASGRAGLDLGVTGAPETFVVDKKGRIRYKQIGPITPDVWRETIQPMIQRLEGEA